MKTTDARTSRIDAGVALLRRRRAALAAFGSIACLSLAGAAWAFHRADLAARMLSSDADATLAHPDLVAYARSRAIPAYAAHCASCHGADMQGDPARGVPNLVDAEWIYGTGRPSEIEQTVLYGIRSGHHRAHDLADMPAYGAAHPYRRYVLPTYTPRQIDDLADYIGALGGRAGDPAAVERGHRLFYSSGQCYDCHTSDASGDNYAGAPSLIDDIWLYGHGARADIVRTLTGGRAGVCPAWTGRLSPGVIRALAVYIGAHAHAPSRSAS